MVTSNADRRRAQAGLGRPPAARDRAAAGRRRGPAARRPPRVRTTATSPVATSTAPTSAATRRLRHRRATPGWSRSAGRTCSPATGPTAPAARTPTAGSAPPTSGSSTPTATCTWSTGRRTWSIVNGFNVYPREVEQVLLELPGVAEAAVVGVPDERTGEAVRRCWCRRPGVELDRRRGARALRAAAGPVQGARRRSSSSPALPRTPTGKVARRQLATRRRTSRDRSRGSPSTRAPAARCAPRPRPTWPGSAASSGASWTAVDVDTDPELRAEYGDRVPVIMIDGREHGFWRVEEPRFRPALRADAAAANRSVPGRFRTGTGIGTKLSL